MNNQNSLMNNLYQCRLWCLPFAIVLALLCISPPGFAQMAPPANRMDYHLSWDGQSTLLKMDIVYRDNGKDSTVFVFGNPQAGGQPRIFDILSNVKTGNGDTFTISRPQRKIVVHHSAHGVDTLHTEIDGKLITDPLRAKPNEAFRTTIATGFFYTMGYQLFMFLQDDSYNQIGIVWDHWPTEMPYLISTNPEAKPGDLQIISSEASARNQIMLQMSTNLVITKMKLDGIPHYLLTSKSDSSSGLPERLKGFVATYMPAIRAFWKDYKAPFFILSVIPLLNEVPSTMTGLGLPNGMSVRYRGAFDQEKLRIIAHEVSHNWIGVNLKLAQKGMENNWFNEGFNDYIAVYNLVKTGLYSKSDFVKYVNEENLAPHYSSPLGQLHGDSIQENFFKSGLYEKLPYRRGFIYAFYLDNQIRLASGGKKTIHNFLLALNMNHSPDGATVLTITDFVRTIRTFLPGKDISTEIKQNLIGGRYIDFRKVKLINGFSMIYEKQIPVLKLSD